MFDGGWRIIHQAERQLAEKDEVFSETCQRLLDAQRRIAQLEDQLVKDAEAPGGCEGFLGYVIYTLVMTNIAIEHGHKNSEFSH